MALSGIIRDNNDKLLFGIRGGNPGRILAREYHFNLIEDPGKLANIFLPERVRKPRINLLTNFYYWYYSLDSRLGDSKEIEFNEEQIDTLRSLGYLE